MRSNKYRPAVNIQSPKKRMSPRYDIPISGEVSPVVALVSFRVHLNWVGVCLRGPRCANQPSRREVLALLEVVTNTAGSLMILSTSVRANKVVRE